MAERTCDRCGGPNPIAWHAPSPLWNAVMRAEDLKEVGFCCPSCFIAVAQERGIDGSWHLTVDGINMARLWDDPDGRVWDADRCLWITPSPPAEPLPAPKGQTEEQAVVEVMKRLDFVWGQTGRWDESYVPEVKAALEALWAYDRAALARSTPASRPLPAERGQ